MFAWTIGAHVIIAAFQVYLLIAVTLQFSTSLPAETCHGTRYSNGSVEFRVSTRGENCLYDWLHNGTVIANGGGKGRDSMAEKVVTHTVDVLILKTPLENISYEEHCQWGILDIPCICNCSILDSFRTDDDGRHHYLVPVLVPVLLLILIVSGVVWGFLRKKNPKLCCCTTRLTAGQQDIV